MKEELKIFEEFLHSKGLQCTSQREIILKVFLKIERHLTVEELYIAVKKKESSIGNVTVFRTLKLLCEAGLAREVDFGDRKLRYEHEYGHEHHDHLICVECGSFIEAVDMDIERLQDEMCARFKFKPLRHRLEIFGICEKCNSGKE